MRVCDGCRSDKSSVVHVSVVKSELSKSKKTGKMISRNRIMINPEIDLCENCIDNFNAMIGNTIKQFREQLK